MSDSADRERWRRLQSLVADALEMSLDERSRYLERECAGDELLVREVHGLLEAYDRAHISFAESDVTKVTLPTLAVPVDLSGRLVCDERVGPYVIREFIAEGAFGEVYVADRTSPMHKRVALKILKRGMDTGQVLLRFEAERQALALMSHSSIADIYDAGTTTEGRAYFAMEYIAGLPVTDHCDRHKLSINERLELFTKICEAVQHAHQKGVVHRDLKPSNILVAYEDDRAIPKIIDFGVAKALNRPLTEDSIYTEGGQVIGTPAYMSPEQADPTPQDIDTRADVYSLGVLLYQLLTGLLPFDQREVGFLELRRQIREVDPPRPSTKLTTGGREDSETSMESARNRRLNLQTLTRRVKGDLDWITMKCLEKDRSRRYASADALAKEILRHLNNEVLLETGPPSTVDRVRKFVKRNRGVVISAGLILAATMAGVSAVSISEYNRRIVLAENARYEARELVEGARSLFYGHFYESDAGVQSGLFSAELERTLERAIEQDPQLDEAELLLAHYLLLAGRRDDAIARAERGVTRHPDSTKLRAMLAGLRDDPEEIERLEDVLRRDHLYYYRALATADHLEAIELLERCLTENEWYFDAKWQLAVRRYALARYEPMLEDAMLLTRVEPDRALVWDLEATALAMLGRYTEAIEAYSKAIVRDDRVWRGYYGRAWAKHKSGEYEAALDDLRLAAERSPQSGAVPALEGAVNLRLNNSERAIEAYDRANALGAEDWWIYRDRADIYRVLARFDEALADVNVALDRIPADLAGDRALALGIRGDVLRAVGKMTEARADLERSRDLNPDYARTHSRLGRVNLLEGRYDEALRSYDEAVRLEPGEGWEVERAIAHWFLGNQDSAIGDLKPLVGEAGYHWVNLWIWDIEQSRHDETAAAVVLRAARAADTGKEPMFTRVIELLEGRLEPSEVTASAQTDEERLYAYYFLGSQARAEGRRDEAVRWYEKARELKLVRELETDLAQCWLRALVP